jgi:hypothetical protein
MTRRLAEVKTRLSPARGTSREVAAEFREIVSGYKPGFFTTADRPIIKSLAAVHIELDRASDAGDTDLIDKLTTVACRLRRSLSLAPTHQNSRGSIQHKAEQGASEGTAPSNPSPEWIRNRWRAELRQ